MLEISRRCLSGKGICFLEFWRLQAYLYTHILSKLYEKIVARKLCHFLEGYSLLPPSQFSYRRILATCDDLLTMSHTLQVALDGGMGASLVQLDFSIAFDRVSHCDLLYKLRFRGVGVQLLSVELQFLKERKQRERLDGKVNVSVDVFLGVPQCRVLEPLLLTCTLPNFPTLLATTWWAICG